MPARKNRPNKYCAKHQKTSAELFEQYHDFIVVIGRLERQNPGRAHFVRPTYIADILVKNGYLRDADSETFYVMPKFRSSFNA